MIRIKMTRYYRTVVLTVPCRYENALLCLWRLGLEHDLEKYSLAELGAVFLYDTPAEHQYVRLIHSNLSLMSALTLLKRVISAPYSLSRTIKDGICSGKYSDISECLTDLDVKVEEEATHQAEFTFPISGGVVEKGGKLRPASSDILLRHEKMIDDALRHAWFLLLQSPTSLYSEVNGLYQKLLFSRIEVEQQNGRLVGKVVFLLNDYLEEDEAFFAAERIAEINGTEIMIYLKRWSVLTDEGLLYVDLCDESGDYGVIPLTYRDDIGEDNDVLCICPEYQETQASEDAVEVEDADWVGILKKAEGIEIQPDRENNYE